MKPTTALFLVLTACATQGPPPADPVAADPPPVEDASLGLSPTSVFDTPTPAPPSASAGFPGSNQLLGAYFTEAPPLIPHQVDAFLPITASSNMCISCHQLPDQVGQEPEAGKPVPVPASHYTDLRTEGATAGAAVVGARYACNQCHVPQTDAKPLVTNTYE